MALKTYFLNVKPAYRVHLESSPDGLVWKVKYEASEETARFLKLNPEGEITVVITDFQILSENLWTLEGRIRNLEKVWCDVKYDWIPSTAIRVLAPASTQLG